MARLFRIRAVALLLAATAMFAAACAIEREPSDLETSKIVQGSVMERATSAVPAYEPDDFPLREAINWYLEETENADLWYVYLLNRDGDPIFYIVSDILPLSVCRSITSPERIVQEGRHPSFVLPAPSLTGTYGSSGECDDYFTRDSSTGAMIRFTPGSSAWIASTVPLALDTDRLRAR